ncbi:unnamed protein product [Coregonus sp. 'balchen']|nr:unnamed protein product [Coregonus sp. 'balchen']
MAARAANPSGMTGTETRINCIRIARKAACKDHRRALEVSQHSEEMGLILGVCAGGLVVLILLLGAIIIIIKKGKPVNINKTPITYRQEKSHMGSMERSEQRSSVNESSSLLGGSPRRQCGRKGSPYHTGQLHPAVRVADLLQHINQMKTAEGYGFKQEYESFFDGWDCTKKKDKTKGRHDTLMGYDRHRVKLHPLLGDSNSDYINANYIDYIPLSKVKLFSLVFGSPRSELAQSKLLQGQNSGGYGCHDDRWRCVDVVDMLNVLPRATANRG